MNKCQAFKYVKWVRDDYIRLPWEYDCWLLNKEWCVRLSIAFVDGIPYGLSCREHDKGNKRMMIHPPRQPSGNLPSKYSDQLCHCCVRSRTIKPLQKRGYSTAYQMHEQRGTFNGIDTCNITSYRNFNFRSVLLRNAEARSIINRPDINALLSQMVEEGTMSKCVAEGKRVHAQKKFGDFNFHKYVVGATYVPLECAILMQRELNDTIIKAYDDENINSGDVSASFKRSWPLMIYPCQKMNSYGAMFEVVPKFHSPTLENSEKMKSSLIWEITGLLLCVEEIWMNVAKALEFYTSDWYGWFLTYLSKKCFEGRSNNQAKNDVFKWYKIQTVKDFVRTVENKVESLGKAFENVEHLIHIDLVEKDVNESVWDMVDSNDYVGEANVIIIESYYLSISILR